MKKLSRKLSRKEGGFFKGSHESEDKEAVKDESIEEADCTTVTVKVTSSEKPKRVQRSLTIDHSKSDSPANISRRKFSEKRTLTLPPTGQICHICYGEFTQPKQLPCQHTFCQNCLARFVNPKLLVECPTCREVGSAGLSARDKSRLTPCLVGIQPIRKHPWPIPVTIFTSYQAEKDTMFN